MHNLTISTPDKPIAGGKPPTKFPFRMAIPAHLSITDDDDARAKVHKIAAVIFRNWQYGKRVTVFDLCQHFKINDVLAHHHAADELACYWEGHHRSEQSKAAREASAKALTPDQYAGRERLASGVA